MVRLRFTQTANHMLLGAVNALKKDLLPGKTFDEPAYTAAITTKFPAMMGDNWGDIKFGGCFIHKSPIVTFDKLDSKRKPLRCEAGDLLVLCRDIVDGHTRINATLFQLKKVKWLYDTIKPDNDIQLMMYTEWPSFSFGKSYKLPHYGIEPKTVTPGAQFMFINESDYYCDGYDHCRYDHQPKLFTHSIPASEMMSDPDLSFGGFLWEFMNWQNGRPISETAQLANDDWSKFIWELIERTTTTVFKHKNVRIPQSIRANGDFFNLMTLPISETHLDVFISDWLSERKMKGDTDIVKNQSEVNYTEDGDDNDNAISILFIDKGISEDIIEIEDIFK